MGKKYLVVVDLDVRNIKRHNENNYNRVMSFISKYKNNYDTIIAIMPEDFEDGGEVYWADLLIRRAHYGLSEYGLFCRLDDIDVIGCNTETSIMKIGFDMLEKKLNFHILAKYCFSLHGHIKHEYAVRCMSEQIGSHLLTNKNVLGQEVNWPTGELFKKLMG